VAPARAAGATDEQLAALDRGELTAPCFDEADQALLAFAVAVVDGPSVPDPIFEAARRHVDDRQLVEIVGLVGYYGMTARICTVFGSRQPQQVVRSSIRVSSSRVVSKPAERTSTRTDARSRSVLARLSLPEESRLLQRLTASEWLPGSRRGVAG
jgi:hypothetical protein